MSYKRVTYKDVAEHAGVSVATVSYVLNNGPRPVSDDTRQRVEEAINELGYYPNEMARSLRLQQSSIIGLIIPSTTNPVYAEVASEFERICTEAGFVVLLCNSARDYEREMKFVHMLRSKGVDGIVMVPQQEPLKSVDLLQKAHIPTLVLEHDLETYHCIAVNDLEGGRLATQHLIDLGHQRIALIRRHPTSATSTERLTGYREALAAANIDFDPALVIECMTGQQAGVDATNQLMALSNPPTAIFTHNDILAMGALHAIHKAGLRVPDDISVVGYDDITSAAYFHPPLTTIRHPKAEAGALAAETLLKLIQGNAMVEPKTQVLPVTLVVRESTGPARR